MIGFSDEADDAEDQPIVPLQGAIAAYASGFSHVKDSDCGS